MKKGTMLFLVPVILWSWGQVCHANDDVDAESDALAVSVLVKKSEEHSDEVRTPNTQTSVAKKGRPAPKKVLPRGPEITSPRGPLAEPSQLSQKQEEMRVVFSECMRQADNGNTVANVVEFVFGRQSGRENGGPRALRQAMHGSVEHHAEEICLTRAFGLRGFRDLAEITNATKNGTLVTISSPYLEIADNEIPEARRYARPWLRDYVTGLAEDMHAHFSGENAPRVGYSPLRITSMIRSFADQAALVRRGASPADCRYGFLCSSHTSGSALDFGFRNVSIIQRLWLERRLVEDQRARKIFFILEYTHYHVFVLPPKYIGDE